jgi:hypothetical protein
MADKEAEIVTPGAQLREFMGKMDKIADLLEDLIAATKANTKAQQDVYKVNDKLYGNFLNYIQRKGDIDVVSETLLKLFK